MFVYLLQNPGGFIFHCVICLTWVAVCFPLSAIALPSPKKETNLAQESSNSSNRKTELQVILVGLIAGDRNEIPSVLVRGKVEEPEAVNFENWKVPYDSIVKVLNIETQSLGGGKVRLNSPGFVTRLNLNQLSEDPKLGRVLSIQEIEDKFGIDARFDLNQYAIILSAPWIGQQRRGPRGFDREREPQLEGLPRIDPAAFNLTSAEQVTTFIPASGFGSSNLEGELTAIGTFLGGSYQVGIDQPNLQQTQSWQLDNFQYFRPRSKGDFIAGEQTPFWIEQGQGEYWGLTYLRREESEAPSLEFSDVSPEGRLETDTFRRDITGEAEPGTLVQLTRGRQEEVLDEFLVGEDGVYRFEDVPFGGRGFQQEYEVLLFPEGRLTLDPEVRTVSFRPLPEQLPSGSVNWLISAGARRKSNNFFREFSELSGGATVRWGVADSLTVGAGVIQDQGFHGWGELFFRPVNIPLEVAIAGVTGEDLETRADYQPTSNLSFNFNSDSVGSNFRTNWQIVPAVNVFGRWDSRQGTEVGIRSRFGDSINRSTNLEISVNEENRIEWQIRQQLGDFELIHRNNNGSIDTEVSYELENDFSSNQESRFNLNYETREFNNEGNQLATLSWEYRSGEEDASGEALWDLEVGYGIGSQGQGIRADIETTLLPGLRLRGRYEQISLASSQNQFTVELTTRLNLQQGISVGDRDFKELQTQGGLLVQPFFDRNGNGRRDPDEEVYTDAKNLLILNGDVLRESEVNQQRDRLLVSVPPDEYRLELDPAGFPLDWQATKTSFAVTVVPGTYTSVTVPLTRSYTVSGTLTNEDNEPIGGARVVAIPKGNGESRFSITNQAGVYFLEQLQQGTYQLKANGQSLQPSTVEIKASSPSLKQLDLVLPSGE